MIWERQYFCDSRTKSHQKSEILKNVEIIFASLPVTFTPFSHGKFIVNKIKLTKVKNESQQIDCLK